MASYNRAVVSHLHQLSESNASSRKPNP
jgi:hypothetical protein